MTRSKGASRRGAESGPIDQDSNTYAAYVDHKINTLLSTLV